MLFHGTFDVLLWTFSDRSFVCFFVVDIVAPNKGKIWILDHQNYSKRFVERQAVSKSQIFDLDSQPQDYELNFWGKNQIDWFVIKGFSSVFYCHNITIKSAAKGSQNGKKLLASSFDRYNQLVDKSTRLITYDTSLAREKFNWALKNRDMECLMAFLSEHLQEKVCGN